MIPQKPTFRLLRTMILFVASLLALSACTIDVPPVAESAPAEAIAPTVESPQSSESAAEDSVQDERVESLAFAVQQSTFLSHVASALSTTGTPDTHHYVELATQDGITWQGEGLPYSDGDLIFLQRAESDGLSAVRLDMPTGADQETIVALLPETVAFDGEPADVDIQFVRARLNSASESAGEPSLWSFDVTVAHPDTGWEDYVDGWHVETSDGRILGTRILLHPHVGEQPFTRGLSNVPIPDDINEVRIRAHDLVSGYGPIGVAIPLDEAGTGDGYEVVR